MRPDMGDMVMKRECRRVQCMTSTYIVQQHSQRGGLGNPGGGPIMPTITLTSAKLRNAIARIRQTIWWGGFVRKGTKNGWECIEECKMMRVELR